MSKIDMNTIVEMVKNSDVDVEKLIEKLTALQTQNNKKTHFKSNEKKKKINCNLDEEQYEKFKVLCDFEGVTFPSKIRIWIENLISKNTDLLASINSSPTSFLEAKKQFKNKWKQDEELSKTMVQKSLILDETLYKNFVKLCSVYGSSFNSEIRKFIRKEVAKYDKQN